MDDQQKHPANEKKVRFRPHLLSSKKENRGWAFIITILSFILSSSLSLASSEILKSVGIVTAFGVVLAIIIVNILFDIIGTAVTAADETPFHAMASRKLYGAKQAIKLVRNADKVSNFCNDVIGDICGVISGTASAYIVIMIVGSNAANSETTIAGLVLPGLVAAMTVGGKSAGKSVAIQNSNYIVYKVGVVLKFLSGKFGNGRKKVKKNSKQRGE